MPRLDGAGVVRAVRERAATRTLPVILIAGAGDATMAGTAERAIGPRRLPVARRPAWDVTQGVPQRSGSTRRPRELPQA